MLNQKKKKKKKKKKRYVLPCVMFTNDRYRRATRPDGQPMVAGDWRLEPTLVRRGAAVGSNATIVAGVTIGEGALVAAGAVVTGDVPAHADRRGRARQADGRRP